MVLHLNRMYDVYLAYWLMEIQHSKLETLVNN